MGRVCGVGWIWGVGWVWGGLVSLIGSGGSGSGVAVHPFDSNEAVGGL
jgi:hypothetical protein